MVGFRHLGRSRRGDSVNISGSRTVTLDGGVDREIADLLLDSGGTLARSAGEILTVTGTIQVYNGSHLDMLAGDTCAYLDLRGLDGLGNPATLTTAGSTNITRGARVYGGDLTMGADLNLSEWLFIAGTNWYGRTGRVYMNGHNVTVPDIQFAAEGGGVGELIRGEPAGTLTVTGTLAVYDGSHFDMLAGDSCSYLDLRGLDGLGNPATLTTAASTNIMRGARVYGGDLTLGADLNLSEWLFIAGTNWYGRTGRVYMNGHNVAVPDIQFAAEGGGVGELIRGEPAGTLTVTGTLSVYDGSHFDMLAGDTCAYLDLRGLDGLGNPATLTTAASVNIARGARVYGGVLTLGANLSLSEWLFIAGTNWYGRSGRVYMNGHNVTVPDFQFAAEGGGVGELIRGDPAGTLTVTGTLSVYDGSRFDMLAGDSCAYLDLRGLDSLGNPATLTTAASANISRGARVYGGDIVLGADLNLSEWLFISGFNWYGRTGRIYMNGHSVTAPDIQFGAEGGGASTSDGTGDVYAQNVTVTGGSAAQFKGGTIQSQINVSGSDILRVLQATGQVTGLTIEGATVNVSAGGQLDLAFSGKPGTGLNWAFRWVGNRKSTIEAWRSAGKLTFSGCLTVKIIEESDGYTYVYAQYEPEMTIDDVEVVEGNSGTVSATFTITITPAGTNDVSVTCATTNGTALAPADYAATNAVVTIPAGSTSVTFTVEVAGDTTFENPDEVFYVNLSAPSNCVIVDSQGVGKILNDDEGLSSMSINDVAVVEGNSGTVNATFTLTLSPASSSNASVTCTTANGTALAPGDYIASNAVVSILAGHSSATFTVEVKGDTTKEYPDEFFYVNLTSPSGCAIADAQGVGTIVGDDETSTALIHSPGSWTNNADWDYGAPQSKHNVYIAAGPSTTRPGTANMDDGGVHQAKQLWIADGGASGTLNVSNGSTATFNGDLLMACWNWAGGSVGTLNIDGSTVSFTGNASIGGEGTARVCVTNGGVINLGGTVYVSGSDSLISVDSTSRINLTGIGNTLYFAGDTSHSFEFANAPADGTVSVRTSTGLWVGRGDDKLTTLTMSAAPAGVRFSGLWIACWDYSSGSTGILNVATGTVAFSGASYIGGEGNAGLTISNNAVINFGSSVQMRTSVDRWAYVTGNGQFNVAGTLSGDARYTADGGTLTVAFGALADETASLIMGDGTRIGWYAVNGGALTLSPLAVSGGAVSWGEYASDATLDRINSLHFQNWVGLTPGQVTISFMDKDNPVAGTMTLIPAGVWNCVTNSGPLAFTSVDMKFHYDSIVVSNQNLALEDLRVFQVVSGKWRELDTTYDAVDATVTCHVTDPLSRFAIAPRIEVDNAGGATNVTEAGAWLNGALHYVGSTNADVWICFGRNDGGTNQALWETNMFVARYDGAATFSRAVSNLQPDTLYFYRCVATNAHDQVDWAPSTESFLTPTLAGGGNVWVETTDASAAEAGPDEGLFTVCRPDKTTTTNGALTVYYTLSGTASNGVDYDLLSGSVVIPTGATSAPVRIVPIDDATWNERDETVILTLTPGRCVPTEPSTGTVVIADDDLPASWPYRVKITFSGYTRGEALTNFPALIVLNETIPGFYYSLFKSTNGTDLRFADATETVALNFEIEQWNQGGLSYVWTQVPLLTNNAYIWAYWGFAGETNLPTFATNGATWSEGYAGVWHLHDVATGSSNAADSTAYGRTFTNMGLAVDAAAGKIAHAEQFSCEADSAFVNGMGLGDLSASGASVEAWVRLRNNPNYPMMLTYNGSDQMDFRFSGSSRQLEVSTAAGALAVDSGYAIPQETWHHVVMTFDDAEDTMRLYIDGENAQTATGRTGHMPADGTAYLGRRSDGYYFDGFLDEVRVSNRPRSPDWVWACWRNANSPADFCTFMRVEERFPGTTLLVR